MNNENNGNNRKKVSSKLKLRRNSKPDNAGSKKFTYKNTKSPSKKVVKKPPNPYICSTSKSNSKKTVKPANPYRFKDSNDFVIKRKGILKKGDKSCWWLTNENGSCNYSKSFNGPTENGGKLLLKWKVNKNIKIRWGSDQIHTYKPAENYDPWIYTHKVGNTTRLLKPYKF